MSWEPIFDLGVVCAMVCFSSAESIILFIAHSMAIGMVSSSEIPIILEIGTLHLHFLDIFYLQNDTNPSLVMFDKNVEDLDMVTCCK